MQQVVLCHCGACQSIINLSVKFIAHFGVISEIKVNRFVKASGLDMIIAHRLLKNNIDSPEYILLTDNFLQHVTDQDNECGLTWQSAAEEFPSIGKVNFQFALLEKLKATIPDPPKHEINYTDQNQSYYEVDISVPCMDAYMALIDIPGRIHWMSGLKEVKQDASHAFVGSIHYCSFDDVVAVISPAHTSRQNEEIFYAETLVVDQSEIYTVYEFRFRSLNGGCRLFARILAMEDKYLPEPKYTFLFEGLKASCHNLKAFCENGFQPLKK
jgi:hypothetical protein